LTFYELKLLDYITAQRKIKTHQTQLCVMNGILHCYMFRLQRNHHQCNVIPQELMWFKYFVWIKGIETRSNLEFP